MSEVVRIAMKRQVQLKEEIGRIEQFLKTAAELTKLDVPARAMDASAPAQGPQDGAATNGDSQAGSEDPAAAGRSPEAAAAGQQNFIPLFRPVREEDAERREASSS